MRPSRVADATAIICALPYVIILGRPMIHAVPSGRAHGWIDMESAQLFGAVDCGGPQSAHCAAALSLCRVLSF